MCSQVARDKIAQLTTQLDEAHATAKARRLKIIEEQFPWLAAYRSAVLRFSDNLRQNADPDADALLNRYIELASEYMSSLPLFTLYVRGADNISNLGLEQ